VVWSRAAGPVAAGGGFRVTVIEKIRQAQRDERHFGQCGVGAGEGIMGGPWGCAGQPGGGARLYARATASDGRRETEDTLCAAFAEDAGPTLEFERFTSLLDMQDFKRRVRDRR
jgi:hypothetical protein